MVYRFDGKKTVTVIENGKEIQKYEEGTRKYVNFIVDSVIYEKPRGTELLDSVGYSNPTK